MTEFNNLRLSITTPPTEDNAGAAYQQVAENRAAAAISDEFMSLLNNTPAPAAKPAPAGGSGNPDFDALMSGGDQAASPAATVEGAKPAGDLDPATGKPMEYTAVDETDDGSALRNFFVKAVTAAPAVGGDVAGGVKESPRQVLGGVLDAFSEADQFMQQLLPLGGVQLFDEEGNFSPEFVSSAKMLESAAAEEDIFAMLAPEDADTVTGGFVRSTAQFLTGFIPGLQASKGMTAVKGGKILAPLAAGAIADMVVFDPNEDRLSTYLNEIPALAGIVPDYLANNEPDQSHWEGRLKNAIEGAGLGVATEGLMSAFRYYKAARAAKKQARAAADPVGATVEAAKDELAQASRQELVQDIPDADLLPLGDPNAGMLIEAAPDETASRAFTRIQEARGRAETSAANQTAMDEINAIRQSFAEKKKIPADRDPMDDMLDELRSGAVSNAKIPRRPVADIVKRLGGVDPASSFAADLRSRGITAKSFPGLFRKGGRESLDNVPASELEIFQARNAIDPDTGYIPQQSFVDGLEAELKGDPWKTTADQQTFDEILRPLDDLEQHLDSLGIDYRTMPNERIKERLKEIEDAEAIYKRDMGEDALFSSPRTAEDLEKEIAEEAAARGVDVDVVREEKRPKVYINHARINSAEDVKAVLQHMAELDAPAITDKTRGVVSNEQTIRESSKEYRDLNDLIGRAPGPMNAAQAVAARRLLASSGEQIVQLAKIAQAPDAKPADLFNFRRAMAVHYALQSEVIAARTETARALQAWAIPAGATKARSQAISELIAQSGGAGDMQALAKAVANAGDNPTAINTMARELGRGRFGKALYQVWINGLLSSPKTHAVNILSNAMNAVYAVPERYMAAGISKIFYNGEIQAGEAAAQAFGLVKGVRDGFRLLAMGNKAENANGVADVFDAFAKVEGTQVNAISAEALGLDSAGSFGYGIDMLGKIVNLPGAALNAEDKLFKTMGYRMELQARAYRQAATEGLEGREFAERVQDILNNPPEDIKADALDFAHYQTFTNPLSAGARQAIGGIAKTPFVGPVFKVVVPFVKTPTNIMKYTFERTPLAYASAAIRADIKAGGARAAQAHARVALGSMVMLTIADMASEGTITGGGPLAADPKKTADLRATRRSAGAPPPYSIKVGDRWYAYNRLDPIGMLMGMGADFSEVAQSAEDADSEMLAGAGVLAIAQNLASKTYLSGVFDFMAAIDPNNTQSTPGQWAADQTTGLVPFSSLLRATTQAGDTVARDAKEVVYGEDNKVDPVASYWQSTVNKIKRGIPGLSDTLPPMRDLWGEPIDRASGLGWGWDFVSPLASKADNPDPVTKVILDNKIALSFPSRRIRNVQLTPEQYDQYSELAGKMARDKIELLTSMPGFDRMSAGPDGMQAELIKNAVNSSRDYAQQQMMLKDPELRERIVTNRMEEVRSLTGQ